MDLEAQVREALAQEVARQSDASEGRLTAMPAKDGCLTVHGDVDLEALAAAIVGTVAGGP